MGNDCDVCGKSATEHHLGLCDACARRWRRSSEYHSWRVALRDLAEDSEDEDATYKPWLRRWVALEQKFSSAGPS